MWWYYFDHWFIHSVYVCDTYNNNNKFIKLEWKIWKKNQTNKTKHDYDGDGRFRCTFRWSSPLLLLLALLLLLPYIIKWLLLWYRISSSDFSICLFHKKFLLSFSSSTKFLSFFFYLPEWNVSIYSILFIASMYGIRYNHQMDRFVSNFFLSFC